MGHFFTVHHTPVCEMILLGIAHSAHTAHLGHAGIRVPQHAPFGVFHPPGLYRGHREVELSHLFRWYISIFRLLYCPSYEPSHRHPFFPSGPVPLPHGAEETFFRAPQQKPPLDGSVLPADKRIPLPLGKTASMRTAVISSAPSQDSINKFSPGCSPTEYHALSAGPTPPSLHHTWFSSSPPIKQSTLWDCGSNLHIPFL